MRAALTTWGGEAGPAARSHLRCLVDRADDFAAGLAEGATGADNPLSLAGLLRNAVRSMQKAVLLKAQTVARFSSRTALRTPPLAPHQLDILIDALAPDAPDDLLLDAADILRSRRC